MTATAGAAGCSSASTSTRPMSGSPSATRNPETLISATLTGRASPAATIEVPARVAPGADVGQRAQRLLPLEEVVEDLFLLDVRRHVDAANFDQARALGQRQGGVGEEAHHLDDDDADPDREGHRQAADDRQAGILHEHPAAEFQVHRPAGEPPEHPGFALMFLHLLDAAECPQGGVARLLRVHAPRDVLILEQLQVRRGSRAPAPVRRGSSETTTAGGGWCGA